MSDLPFDFALNLHQTKVTDAGLKQIKGFKHLTELNLNHTQVTDAGLHELRELENLTVLGLRTTNVTDNGLKNLKKTRIPFRLGP